MKVERWTGPPTDELVRLQQRRGALFPQDPGATNRPFVGLALSGGGIRSATFCLGLLRALGREELIPRIDYLSTVSGGGYTGSFLCSMYVPSDRRGETPRAAAKWSPSNALPPVDPFAKDGQDALLHLRNSGRHLLPGGAGDVIRVMAMMTRNWIAVHFVIGITLLALLLLPKLLQAGLLAWGGYLEWEAGWASRLPEILWPSKWLQGYSLSGWFTASWLFPLAALLLLPAAACGSAFWLSRRGRMTESRFLRWWAPSGYTAVLTGIVGTALFFVPALLSGWSYARFGGVLLMVLGWGSIAVIIGAQRADQKSVPPEEDQTQKHSNAGANEADSVNCRLVQEDRVRSILTNWLALWLGVALLIAAIALLDSIAQSIYLLWDDLTAPQLAGSASLAALVPLGRWALQAFSGAGEGSRFKQLAPILARFGHLIALAVGVFLALAVGLFWATLAHAIAWRGGPIGLLTEYGQDTILSFLLLFAAWMVFAFAAIFLGRSWAFVNLSSYAAFYGSRLRRAYLGASNRRRQKEQRGAKGRYDDLLDDNCPGDDIEVSDRGYYADDVLAPLHLINVTVNDTASGSSNLTTQDRQGKPLVVSPAGIFVAGRTAGEIGKCIPFPNSAAASQAQQLPLSAWVGISGAAFSTGAGRFGSMGLSLLAGLTNLRTGYWWEEKNEDYKFPRDTVQAYLWREFLGRFRGTDEKRWYLSDGGHFENLGVFELLRRRINFIIAADCGADPGYKFGDLIGLIRLARIELETEVDFLEEDQLDAVLGPHTQLRRLFSTLTDLSKPRGERDRRTGPYAALAQLYQADAKDQPWGTLLLIKPRICGAEMADLLAYQRENPKFPQQPTSDQFFDEAQWESYYRLGELIGENLFGSGEQQWAQRQWRPRNLVAINSFVS